jgi:diaminopimelate epimerase
MKLAKLHGLGNDFLIADARTTSGLSESLSQLAVQLCRRHTGIGGDGVLFFQPTQADAEADVSALIYNADGSRAEMSGNGTRCLAAFLVHSGELDSGIIRIRTVVGIRTFTLQDKVDKAYFFESSMGVPITEPARIPVRIEARRDTLVDYPLDVGTCSVRVTISSMGNPHCSTFWPDVEAAPLQTLGPALENHSYFPNRTNVEFIQVLDRHRIRVRFWERGVGPTLASGTGSSAAVVASLLNGYVESPVTVEVEMGQMLVRWLPPGELYLTGSAEHVCTVEFP